MENEMQRTSLAAVVLFLISTVIYSQTVVEGDNSVCTANNEPYQCCSGNLTGNCEGKGIYPYVLPLNKFSEACASFWYGPKCDDEPYFGAEVCSLADRNAGAPLPTVTCDNDLAESGYCRANLGCAALDDPWNCCTGLNTGTCPYDGSTSTPKKSVCFKAFDLLMNPFRDGRGQAGQKLQNEQDNPPFVPEEG